MLSVKVVEEICRLLAEGELSQRAIAKRLSVSRGVIGAIASGKRGIYGRETPRAADPTDWDGQPPQRCPTCGGMVRMPCLLCEARAYRRRQRRNARALTEQRQSRRVA
ncbi:MAG: hypothetical protein CMJ58_03090 [Planctomycetaceae bacterium]|nr:hypothetical protein [Planctomycetaceae bacterium]